MDVAVAAVPSIHAVGLALRSMADANNPRQSRLSLMSSLQGRRRGVALHAALLSALARTHALAATCTALCCEFALRTGTADQNAAAIFGEFFARGCEQFVHTPLLGLVALF